MQTQRNLFWILLIHTQIRLYLPFSDWLGTKRNLNSDNLPRIRSRFFSVNETIYTDWKICTLAPPLKPLGSGSAVIFGGFSRVPSIGRPWLPRDASLSNGCTFARLADNSQGMVLKCERETIYSFKWPSLKPEQKFVCSRYVFQCTVTRASNPGSRDPGRF